MVRVNKIHKLKAASGIETNKGGNFDKHVLRRKNMTFDKLLAKWTTAHDNSTQLLEQVVAKAVENLKEAFDLGEMNKLNEAIMDRKNTVRHPAFVQWIGEHFPVRMHKGMLKKSDVRFLEMDWEGRKEEICQAALKVHFWDHKPGKVQREWTEEQALKSSTNNVVKLADHLPNMTALQLAEATVIELKKREKEALAAAG